MSASTSTTNAISTSTKPNNRGENYRQWGNYDSHNKSVRRGGFNFAKENHETTNTVATADKNRGTFVNAGKRFSRSAYNGRGGHPPGHVVYPAGASTVGTTGESNSRSFRSPSRHRGNHSPVVTGGVTRRNPNSRAGRAGARALSVRSHRRCGRPVKEEGPHDCRDAAAVPEIGTDSSPSTAREVFEQSDELMALASIYEQPKVFNVVGNGFEGYFSANVELPNPFFVSINRTKNTSNARSAHSLDNEPEKIPIKYLPPITLFFKLPNDYPSTRQPQFRLSCRWLTKEQLSKLGRRLDEIWNEDKGEVVLFKWTVFLNDDVLTHLNIEDTLDLSYISIDRLEMADGASGSLHYPSPDRHDSSAKSSFNLLPEILEFDERRKEEVFRTEFFKCDVCFDERIGAKCIRFKSCEHTYCRDCMKSYFEIQINEGNVGRLTCPTEKCLSQALPSQVRDLVGPELFAKYDQLLLASTLDSMSDITYCPRDSCQAAVLFEPGSSLASCPSCRFAFCTFCLVGYHGIEPCKLKYDERLQLYNKYTSGNDEERARLEARYGRKQLRRLVEATMSDTWIQQNSKSCPRCKSQIERVDGCNKMTCWKCSGHFCWLCLQRLDPVNPYRHYDKGGNGSCYGMLFHGTNAGGDDEEYFDFEDEDFDDGFDSDLSDDEYE